MDQIVRTALWVALFGGTGIVIVAMLPGIVVWCLDAVENASTARSRSRTLHTGRREPHRHIAHAPANVHES